MCLAIPGKIISVAGDDPITRMGRIDFGGVVKEASLAYLPEAQVVHYVGQSSDQVVAARHIYFQTSKVHYFHKWHGAFQADLLRVCLLSQYVWQIGLEGVKGLFGSKSDLRKQRVKVYWQVVRTGLK